MTVIGNLDIREPLKIDFLLIKTSIATTQHGLKPILQELLEVPLKYNRQGQKTATATISQITIPRTILLTAPRN